MVASKVNSLLVEENTKHEMASMQTEILLQDLEHQRQRARPQQTSKVVAKIHCQKLKLIKSFQL